MTSGCLVAPVMPPPGMLYTDYKAPLDFDMNATKNATRRGESETMSILGLVALGDGSVKTAAQNGGITTIHSADYEYFNIIGVYQRYRTVVYGD
ncbi:MAG: TRL-like family protein [Candidatus Sumerlaeia bacterium]|nr:TRL-like family protein [Candidatus Sumerlaeia bacterium]